MALDERGTLEYQLSRFEARMNTALEHGRYEVAHYLLQRKKAAQEELLRLSFLADPTIVQECVNGPG